MYDKNMDTWVASLVVLLVVVDLAVLAWVVTRARSATRARKEACSEWLAALQQDPHLWRRYEAHWKARWRTGVGYLVDMVLSMGVSATLTFLLLPLLGLGIEDDATKFLFLGVALATCLSIVYGSLWLLGTTLGLWLLGIAVVSPCTKRLASPRERRPPTKWDYRRDRVPGLLFVPRDMLGM
ncbi:MAG: hypothetical protein ACP5PX_06870 [Candidatus Hadarchaeum sp.]|uniref:hypothetical protein n=1 Tax=Candidatus Hadarchaeum sp. TaxID=2883567 RepID=UPI003D0EE970